MADASPTSRDQAASVTSGAEAIADAIRSSANVVRESVQAVEDGIQRAAPEIKQASGYGRLLHKASSELLESDSWSESTAVSGSMKSCAALFLVFGMLVLFFIVGWVLLGVYYFVGFLFTGGTTYSPRSSEIASAVVGIFSGKFSPRAGSPYSGGTAAVVMDSFVALLLGCYVFFGNHVNKKMQRKLNERGVGGGSATADSNSYVEEQAEYWKEIQEQSQKDGVYSAVSTSLLVKYRKENSDALTVELIAGLIHLFGFFYCMNLYVQVPTSGFVWWLKWHLLVVCVVFFVFRWSFWFVVNALSRSEKLRESLNIKLPDDEKTPGGKYGSTEAKV
eukprot:g2913.t1